MTAANRRIAFTLLEMLVAMTLMSILATSLYASLHAGFRGRRTTDEALEPVQRAAAAMRMVRADLDSAVVPSGLLAGEFIGEDELSDADLENVSGGSGDLQLLALQHGSSGQAAKS